MKLAQKIRIGAKIKRIYSKATTPLDRLLESDKGDRVKLEALRRLRERTDPFELSETIDKKLSIIWALASRAKLRLADKPKPRSRTFLTGPHDYELPTSIFLPMRNLTVDRFREVWARERRLNTN